MGRKHAASSSLKEDNFGEIAAKMRRAVALPPLHTTLIIQGLAGITILETQPVLDIMST
jgi:hypothetical protein